MLSHGDSVIPIFKANYRTYDPLFRRGNKIDEKFAKTKFLITLNLILSYDIVKFVRHNIPVYIFMLYHSNSNSS